MNELVQAFILGNQAILTNSCMLPLYPGLIAFLVGNANNERSRRATGWLGLLVLAGILTTMILIGFILFLINLSFGDLFTVLLPIIYGVVIVLGLGMLAGWNPFAKLSTTQAPVLRNPYITAYVYGLLFGPMTLPCTGPIILSAFAVGAGDAAQLADGLLFFLIFGLGFGWPLVVLPLLSMPFQRRFVGWLTENYVVMTRVSGVLLIAVGIFGILTELVPQYNPEFLLEGGSQLVFWLLVFVIAGFVGWMTYRSHHSSNPTRLEVG